MTDFAIISQSLKNGTNANGTIFIPNPTVATFDMGNITMNMYVNGTYVGNSTIKDTVIRPGNNTFEMYATTDGDALLRAPVKSKWGNRRNMHWWDEPSMPALFSASVSSPEDTQAAYDVLAERFRADLYVTRQTRPLLATRP